MLIYTGPIKIWFLFSFLFELEQHIYAQEISSSSNKRKIANSCKTSAECPINAFCEHNTIETEFGQCVCDEGYFIVEENKLKRCQKVAKHLGEPCKYQAECHIPFSTDSECRDSTCQCKTDAHYVPTENACFRNSLIGEYCRVAPNCIGEGTVCRDGRCHCPYYTHPTANNSHCLKDVALGEPCTVDEECTTINSRCHDVCRCKAGHILNTNKTECLKIATKLYDSCDTNEQCLATIRCSKCSEDKICVCTDGFHDVNYQCFVSIPLGLICESNESCITNNTFCYSNHCICREGFHQVGKECSSATITYDLAKFLTQVFVPTLIISFIMLT